MMSVVKRALIEVTVLTFGMDRVLGGSWQLRIGVNHGCPASNSQQFALALSGWFLIRPGRVGDWSITHNSKHFTSVAPSLMEVTRIQISLVDSTF